MKDFLSELDLKELSEMDVRMMNPLKLAFVGDAIYESYVRVYIISKHVMTPNEMSKLCTNYVRASAQSKAVHGIREQLSEMEWDYVKRGRNQKTGSVPKNSSLSDYKYATGFEVLVGYLFLTRQKSRLDEIVKMAIVAIESPVEKKVVEDEAY